MIKSEELVYSIGGILPDKEIQMNSVSKTKNYIGILQKNSPEKIVEIFHFTHKKSSLLFFGKIMDFNSKLIK